MSETTEQVKQKRKYALAKLTRVRRRALVMVNAKGSRRDVLKVLPELDEAFLNVEILSDKYIETLEDADGLEKAQRYKQEAERQYEETMIQVQQYLSEQKDEPESVAGGSQCSKTSQLSSASRKAEVTLKMKEFELEQLKRRHERERQEEEMKRANQLEDAKEARAAAELEAKLTLAAESELTWERRHDFIEEKTADEEGNDGRGVEEFGKVDPASRVSLSHYDAAQQSLMGGPEAPRPSYTDHVLRNLPRLELTKFSGAPGEWPKWFSLFQTLVGNQPHLSETEKMAHLQGAVVGSAQTTIAGMLYDGRLYKAALKALENRYGRQEDVVHANMTAIFKCPSPRYLDAESMDQFHAVLHSAVSVLQNMGYDDDLRSSENLRSVVKKLPLELKKDWGQHVLNLEPVRPTLVDLDMWLQRQVRVAINFETVSTEDNRTMKARKSGAETTSTRRAAFNTDVAGYSVCISCGEQHRLDSCPLFLEKGVDSRAEFVMSSNTCFYCLKTGHKSRQCRLAKPCGIDGCRVRHHRLLHGSRRLSRSTLVGETNNGNNPGEDDTARVIAAACKTDRHATTLLQVVRVRIMGEQGRTRTVNALLDPGAQTSLCCAEVLRDLNITGDTQGIQLQTVRGCGTTQSSQRVKLTLLPIEGPYNNPILVSEVFSVPDLHLKTPYPEQRMQDWEHLKGLNIAGYNGQRVELLLGANTIEAVLQREARVGKPGEPVAVKTAFGWALTGSINSIVPEHMKQVFCIYQTETNEAMHDLQMWWSTESFGTKYEDKYSLSVEDRRAMQILTEKTRKVGNHYEVGLLWKSDEVRMPNNYNAAFRRLLSTERSLNRQPEKAEAYKEVLMGYVRKGHARKLTNEEMLDKTPKTWFLPHHGVSNPNKAKIRVVFDAAASYKGTSLNEQLLTGPDLLQNLVGILVRFREERVALMADITEMFHQVRVREEDQPALTFLWRDCDASKPPDQYRMLVTVFGARCSPAAASYVLGRTADDHQTDSPTSVRAAAAVRSSFYMDDFLHSEKTVDEAKDTQENVTKIVSGGGFVLTKWVSSHPETLDDSPAPNANPSTVDLSRHQQGCERALGCVWSPQADTIGVKHRDKEVPETKRGVLRRVSMIFDPPGLSRLSQFAPKCSFSAYGP